jgi:hypothetical protein
MLLSLCCTLPAPVGQETPAQRARKQAGEFGQAFVKGEYATVVDYLHPGVVAKKGGREKVIADMTEEVEKLKPNVEFRAFTFEAPGPVASAGGELYTVLPCSIEAVGFGQKVTVKTYMIGVSTDQGKTWVFVGGHQKEEDLAKIREVLPNLPESLALPAPQEPIVETIG